MTQEEKIKDLEQRLALMDADNSALAVELAHYKKVAAGLKGRNKQLAEQVEHYKNLDLEGDHLYEDVITELDKAKKEINQLLKQSCDVVPKKDYEELEKTLERKKVFIEQLQDKAHALLVEKAGLESSLSIKEDVINDLKNEIIELSKPWWKKLF
jgi:chromosome segregation ATPase